jgi:hypothetical protein
MDFHRSSCFRISRTTDDVLSPQAIGAGGIPTPAALVTLSQITALAQVAVGTGREVKIPHFAAETAIILRGPDLQQRSLSDIAQVVTGDLLAPPVYGEVAVIMG